jgi:hypothetical protein
MKAYWGNGSIAPHILDLSVDGGEWSASCPDRFIPRKRAHDTHWIGDWVFQIIYSVILQCKGNVALVRVHCGACDKGISALR